MPSGSDFLQNFDNISNFAIILVFTPFLIPPKREVLLLPPRGGRLGRGSKPKKTEFQFILVYGSFPKRGL
jgi:hypothetical protein